MDLSIIIINFNTDELLGKCLKSIQGHIKGIDFEVIVVNNGTTDPSQIIKNFPLARIIEVENHGFSAGNNAGAEISEGRVLLFLNSDTELLNDEVGGAIDKFKTNPRLGLVAPRIELETGDLQPGAFGQLPTVFSTVQEKLGIRSNSDPDGEVEWVTGAALFIPRAVYREIGGFDEKFFMYMEDVDLGARVNEAGYEAEYFPKLRILHRLGSSISKNIQRKRYFRESQNHYFRKHHGWAGEWIMRILRLPYRLIRDR